MSPSFIALSSVSSFTRDLIHPAADAEGQDNFFWRLARGTEETNYLLASERSLSQIDVRV